MAARLSIPRLYNSHACNSKLINRTIQPVANQHGANGLDTDVPAHKIALGEVFRESGRLMSELLKDTQNSPSNPWRQRQQCLHRLPVQHQPGRLGHDLLSLALQCFVPFNEFLERHLLPFVHSTIRLRQCGGVIGIALIHQVLEEGCHKELLILRHPCDFLRNLGH